MARKKKVTKVVLVGDLGYAKIKEILDELRELLLTEATNVNEGILMMAKKQFGSDLHQGKIARAIELLNSL